MKDLVKRAKSFIIFDYPLQTAYITRQFASIHQKLQAETPGWSTIATRQKLIFNYWFTHVAGHFALLFGLPALTVFLLPGSFEQPIFYLFNVLLAGLLSYPILYLFHYRPYFDSIFLPRLETVKEAYERKQIEQLEKCRQAQLSNFSLALFFYVLTNTNSIITLKCDDYSASLLMKLYGVDQGSIKKNLELILGTAKRRSMTDRKITELRNRFNETYSFMEDLKFTAGIDKLKELEMRFFKS